MEHNISSDITLIFKQLTEELSAPLLTADNFNHTFNFIKNDLKPLYEFNDDFKKSIHYLNNMVDALNANQNNPPEEKLFGLTLIVNEYLCVNDKNKSHLESKYEIVQFIIQACFNQILQQLFIIINKRDMDTNDIEDALNLFKNTFEDIFANTKGYKLHEKIINID